MPTIQDLRKKYHPSIAPLDMELLFSSVSKKTREFILAHPEHKLDKNQTAKLDILVSRRAKGEPIAYILGKKEFYGLDFRVNDNTLIPRPETEMMVDLALEEISKLVSKRLQTINVVDIGTGSGNIIISLAYNLPTGQVGIKHGSYNELDFYGLDISSKALSVAKENAKRQRLGDKIKFIKGNLLEPILKNKKYIIPNLPAGRQGTRYIILANLPYLSSQVYSSAPKDVKLYEPKSALYSPQKGLEHYTKLLKQIAAECSRFHVTCYMEINPGQKSPIQKIISQIIPSAKIEFFKDLSGRWRICKIEI